MGMNGAAGPPLGGAPADADRAFLEHLVDKMNACKEAEAIDFMTVEKVRLLLSDSAIESLRKMYEAENQLTSHASGRPAPPTSAVLAGRAPQHRHSPLVPERPASKGYAVAAAARAERERDSSFQTRPGGGSDHRAPQSAHASSHNRKTHRETQLSQQQRPPHERQQQQRQGGAAGRSTVNADANNGHAPGRPAPQLETPRRTDGAVAPLVWSSNSQDPAANGVGASPVHHRGGTDDGDDGDASNATAAGGRGGGGGDRVVSLAVVAALPPGPAAQARWDAYNAPPTDRTVHDLGGPLLPGELPLGPPPAAQLRQLLYLQTCSPTAAAGRGGRARPPSHHQLLEPISGGCSPAEELCDADGISYYHVPTGSPRYSFSESRFQQETQEHQATARHGDGSAAPQQPAFSPATAPAGSRPLRGGGGGYAARALEQATPGSRGSSRGRQAGSSSGGVRRGARQTSPFAAACGADGFDADGDHGYPPPLVSEASENVQLPAAAAMAKALAARSQGGSTHYANGSGHGYTVANGGNGAENYGRGADRNGGGSAERVTSPQWRDTAATRYAALIRGGDAAGSGNGAAGGASPVRSRFAGGGGGGASAKKRTPSRPLELPPWQGPLSGGGARAASMTSSAGKGGRSPLRAARGPSLSPSTLSPSMASGSGSGHSQSSSAAAQPAGSAAAGALHSPMPARSPAAGAVPAAAMPLPSPQRSAQQPLPAPSPRRTPRSSQPGAAAAATLPSAAARQSAAAAASLRNTHSGSPAAAEDGLDDAALRTILQTVCGTVLRSLTRTQPGFLERCAEDGGLRRQFFDSVAGVVNVDLINARMSSAEAWMHDWLIYIRLNRAFEQRLNLAEPGLPPSPAHGHRPSAGSSLWSDK